MYIYKPVFGIFLLLLSCSSGSVNSDNNEITESGEGRNYRQDMRNFVIDLKNYSETIRPDFDIIPQNGIELVTDSGDPFGNPQTDYLNAISGNGQESLFYGYNRDNKSTPDKISAYTRELLEVSKKTGNTILVTDYCNSPDKVDNSLESNANLGFIPFPASERMLDTIPDYPSPIFRENADNIELISQARNFLYLINYQRYDSKEAVLKSLENSNYDLILMDLFYNDGSPFSASDLSRLKQKANGGERLLYCYMSIGEAEDYRYYWEGAWDFDPPDWLAEENPDWPGNYKVRYWESSWQNLIYGDDDSYLSRIITTGFDGVYLDIIDAFEFFE